MRFLEHLVDQEILPQEILDTALRIHGRKQRAILNSLTEQALLEPKNLMGRLSNYYRIPVIDLEKVERDHEAIRLVPFEIAKRYDIFPVRVEAGKLLIAINDPSDFFTLDDLRSVSQCGIECVLSHSSDIRKAIEKHYCMEESLTGALKELVLLDPKTDTLESDKAIFSAGDHHSPVSKTVQFILENAIQRKASDIHFEPQENTIELRYRIDGDLETAQTLPCSSYASIVARIKILSQLDIAEKRKPQDGRARILFRGQKVDLRISMLPTIFGEKVVVRLLSQESLAVDSLDSLRFSEAQMDAYQKAITAKEGIVLVTGPTGSGKTTTLYTSLNFIKSKKHNITTIEDPIEYLLGGVNQSQINPKIGVTFASMLRSILRQDPDVILVGEIRDKETAEMAFRSSLTGHLVFSTLHANNAIGAVTRLFDLGIEPYLAASALSCVVAQRLVRAICQNCRDTYHPDSTILESVKEYLMPAKPMLFYRGRGCAKCSYTGFLGRVAIFEVLPIADELKAAIYGRVPEHVIYQKARRSGFKTMMEDSIDKALQGIIRLEETLPFLPNFGMNESDPLIKLVDYIELNQKKKLAVLRNEEMISKIVADLSPEDYVLLDPSGGPAALESDRQGGGNAVLTNGTHNSRSHEDKDNPAARRNSLDQKNESEEEERRRHPRITRDFVANYRVHGAQEHSAWEAAIIKNLSAEGCFFSAKKAYHEGKEIEIRLHLPTSTQPVCVKGVIRRCREPQLGERFHSVGVSFAEEMIDGPHVIDRTVSFFLSKIVQKNQ